MSNTPIKIKTIILLTIISLICILFILDLIGNICPFTLMAKSVDTPIIVARKNDLLFTKVSQIVSDDNRIYVLFGTYSVVQVYTHEGEYLYTISVYNHLNGRTEIAAHNNYLYIRDKIGNVYVFSSDCFVERIDRTEQANLPTMLSFGISDSAYSVRLGSIWESETIDSAKCVIQRPIILSIYQNNTIFLMKLILVMIAGFVLFIPPARKRT